MKRFSSTYSAAQLHICWVPVPAGGHPDRRAVVPALRIVIPDLEGLLAKRGIKVGHLTLFRWVQRFTPLLVDAARPCRYSVGDR